MAHTGIKSSPLTANPSLHNTLVIASPVAIVLLGSLASRVSLRFFGQWAWAGTAPVYWGSMFVVIALLAGRDKALSWFGKSRGSFFWPILGVLVGLSAFPLLLLPNLSLLRIPSLAVLWIAFGLVNGILEEAYWRGFLYKEIRGWPLWLRVAYSSILFIAIHFLMLGAFAPSLFNIPFLVILTVLTLVYAVIFIRTGSLRWPVVSHILTDWGNMNIFVFMNMTRIY